MGNHTETAKRQITEIVADLLADDRDRRTAVLGYADLITKDSTAQRGVLAAVVAALPRKPALRVAKKVPEGRAGQVAEFRALVDMVEAEQELGDAEEERLHTYLEMWGHSIDVTEVGE
jgi:hypothetical protein